MSIHVRPREVNDRVMPGHLAGDLPKGADKKAALGVLVGRSSRLTLLAKVEDATAASAVAGFAAKLKSIAAPLHQTLTSDQGKELTRHKHVAARRHPLLVKVLDSPVPLQKLRPSHKSEMGNVSVHGSLGP